MSGIVLRSVGEIVEVGETRMERETIGRLEVLVATMNTGFSVFPDASFPVYTLNTNHGRAARRPSRS